MVTDPDSPRGGGWLVALLVLGALPVHAGWSALSVPGTPRDVQIVGAGRFSVATSDGAYAFQGLTQLFGVRQGESLLGSFLAADGCMCAIDGSNGRLTGSCDAAQEQLFGSGILRMRHSGAGGGGYLSRTLGGTGALFYFPAGITTALTPGQTQVAIGASLPMFPMDVEVTPQGTMALVQVQFGGSANTTLMVVRENVVLGTVSYAGTGSARAVDLVSTPSGLHAFIAADDGLFRLDSADGGSTWSVAGRVFTPQAGEGARGVSLDGRGGLSGANGHGAMVIAGGSNDRMFRSVPTFPLQGGPGAEWIETTTGLSASAPFEGVTCLGGHTCVAHRSVSGSNNLALYRNEAAPIVVPGPALAPVGEGAPLVLSLESVTDADGDPVALQWSVETDVGAPPLHTVSGRGRQLTVDTAGLQVCEPTRAVTVKTVASDGLAAHQNTTTQVLQVLRSRTPKVQPASGELLPGDAPLSLEAVADDFAVCAPSAWRWSVSGPALLSPLNGPQTALSTTQPVCSPQGADVTVVVEATAPNGNVSSPPAVFRVPAWGPSPEPFPGTSVAQQVAGSTQRYGAAAHACEGTGDFPGQRTRWQLTSAPPEDVRLIDDSGNAVSSTAVTAGLTVEAGACSAGTLDFEVESGLVGGTWPAARSSLTVEIVQPVFTLDDATIAVSQVDASGGLVRGTLSTNIPCPQAAGWMASIQLRQAGVAVGPPTRLSPDAPFELPVPELCSGGTYTLEATLLDAAGNPGMQVHVPLTAEPAPARVGTLVESPVLAGCAQGVRAALTLEPPAGSCLGATWTWTRVAGPALTEDVRTGRTVTIASAAGLPLEELVGRTWTFEVRADAGGGNQEVREIVVPIGSELLVDVQVRTEPALVAAEGYTGARISMSNATSCALRALQLHAPMRGLVVAPGPIALEGEPTAVSLGAGGVTVSEVALDPHGGAALELLVRPSLSGQTPRLEAQVLLNGVRVSAPIQASEVPTGATGCGCAGAPAGGGGLIPILLALLWRSRSRRPPERGPANPSGELTRSS